MKILSIIILTVIALNSNAQLQIRNGSSKPISVAIGWYAEGNSYNGIITRGWYNIEPGVTIAPGLNFTSKDDFFYYYVESQDESKFNVEAEYDFLVSSGAFEIKNADMQYVKDENSEYSWKKFTRQNVFFGILEARTYTLNIAEAEESTDVPIYELAPEPDTVVESH